MSRQIRTGLVLSVFATASAALVGAQTVQQVWQADIQIRTLEVTKTRTSLMVRVLVYSDNNDEAKDSRLLVLLPVGAGLERIPPGCAASAGPSMVPSLRAMVQCELGAIPVRGFREVLLSTTLPPDGMPKRFGVFAYSGTPDPTPANNYAERIIP